MVVTMAGAGLCARQALCDAGLAQSGVLHVLPALFCQPGHEFASRGPLSSLLRYVMIAHFLRELRVTKPYPTQA